MLHARRCCWAQRHLRPTTARVVSTASGATAAATPKPTARTWEIHDLDEILNGPKADRHPYFFDKQGLRIYGRGALVPREQYPPNWQKRIEQLNFLRQMKRSSAEIYALKKGPRKAYNRALNEYVRRLKWYSEQLLGQMHKQDPLDELIYLSQAKSTAIASDQDPDFDESASWTQNLKKFDIPEKNPDARQYALYRRSRRLVLEYERLGRENLDPMLSNHPLPRKSLWYWEKRPTIEEASLIPKIRQDGDDSDQEADSDNDVFLGSEGEEEMFIFQVQKGMIHSPLIENEAPDIMSKYHRHNRIAREMTRKENDPGVAADMTDVQILSELGDLKLSDMTAEQQNARATLDAMAFSRIVGRRYIQEFKKDEKRYRAFLSDTKKSLQKLAEQKPPRRYIPESVVRELLFITYDPTYTRPDWFKLIDVLERGSKEVIELLIKRLDKLERIVFFENFDGEIKATLRRHPDLEKMLSPPPTLADMLGDVDERAFSHFASEGNFEASGLYDLEVAPTYESVKMPKFENTSEDIPNVLLQSLGMSIPKAQHKLDIYSEKLVEGGMSDQAKYIMCREIRKMFAEEFSLSFTEVFRTLQRVIVDEGLLVPVIDFRIALRNVRPKMLQELMKDSLGLGRVRARRAEIMGILGPDYYDMFGNDPRLGKDIRDDVEYVTAQTEASPYTIQNYDPQLDDYDEMFIAAQEASDSGEVSEELDPFSVLAHDDHDPVMSKNIDDFVDNRVFTEEREEIDIEATVPFEKIYGVPEIDLLNIDDLDPEEFQEHCFNLPPGADPLELIHHHQKYSGKRSFVPRFIDFTIDPTGGESYYANMPLSERLRRRMKGLEEDEDMDPVTLEQKFDEQQAIVAQQRKEADELGREIVYDASGRGTPFDFEKELKEVRAGEKHPMFLYRKPREEMFKYSSPKKYSKFQAPDEERDARIVEELEKMMELAELARKRESGEELSESEIKTMVEAMHMFEHGEADDDGEVTAEVGSNVPKVESEEGRERWAFDREMGDDVEQKNASETEDYYEGAEDTFEYEGEPEVKPKKKYLPKVPKSYFRHLRPGGLPNYPENAILPHKLPVNLVSQHRWFREESKIPKKLSHMWTPSKVPEQLETLRNHYRKKRVQLGEFEMPKVLDPKYDHYLKEAARIIIRSKQFTNEDKVKMIKTVADQYNAEMDPHRLRRFKPLTRTILRPKVMRDIVDAEADKNEKIKVVKNKYVRKKPDSNPTPTGASSGLVWRSEYGSQK